MELNKNHITGLIAFLDILKVTWGGDDFLISATAGKKAKIRLKKAIF